MGILFIIYIINNFYLPIFPFSLCRERVFKKRENSSIRLSLSGLRPRSGVTAGINRGKEWGEQEKVVEI